MGLREPVEATNLDIYGNAPLQWSRALEALRNRPTQLTHVLGTVRPDGRPHAVFVDARFDNQDGSYYFVAGPGTRRARNLAANPACTIAAQLTGIDLVLDGTATRVTDPDTLERISGIYRDAGWPVHVEGEAIVAPYNAPSAGPPPWHLYRFQVRHRVYGVAGVEPAGATRWRF